MSSVGLEYRTLRIGAVNGLNTILTMGMQVLTVPICLQYWGRESYGLWSSLMALYLFLQATSAGYANYTSNRVHLLYHENESRVQETLASTLVGIAFFGCLQLAAAAFLIKGHNLPGLLGVSDATADHHGASFALLFMVAYWAFGGLTCGMVHRLAIPAGLMYPAAWWVLIGQLCSYLTVLLSAGMRTTVLQACVVYLTVQLVFAASLAWYLRCKLPRFFPWWKGFHFRTGFRDLYHSVFHVTCGFVQQGSGQVLVVLVASLSGAAAVPVYTTVRTLSNLWSNLSNVVTAPLLPEVVRYYATGNKNNLRHLQEAHALLLGTIVNLSVVLAFPLIGNVYGHWTRHSVHLDRRLLCLLLASVCLANAGALMNTFLSGINHRRSLVGSTVARGGCSVVIGGLAIHAMGLAGLGWGVWLGELLSLAVLFLYFNTCTGHTATSGMAWSSMAPCLLSLLSLHAFLVMELLEMGRPEWRVLIGSLCIGAAGVWGWTRLHKSVQQRLAASALRFFAKALPE